MPRPLAFDKDHAVETTMQEFWKHGYSACSAKHLSEVLKITRSSFYNAFGSRDELFAEAIGRYAERPPNAPVFAFDRSMPLKAAVTEYFRSLCQARGSDVDKKGCLATKCVASLVPGDDGAAGLMTEMAQSGLHMLETRLAWAVEDGDLPKDTDTKALARAMNMLIFGVNIQSQVEPEPELLWSGCRISLAGWGLLDETNRS